MDVRSLKDRAREAWGAGRYDPLGRLLEPAACVLVDVCGVADGERVLDVGTGDGNAALEAARRGASVVASDLAESLLDAGRGRADAERLALEWVQADAEELPFEDESFDVVMSCFGAVLAPRPELVARELMRVVRPEGRVAITAWPPDGSQARFMALSASYAPPPPPDLPKSTDWGDPEIAAARFASADAVVETRTESLVWRFETWEDVRTLISPETSGNMGSLMRSLPPDRARALQDDAIALFVELSGGTGPPYEVPSDYVIHIARRSR